MTTTPTAPVAYLAAQSFKRDLLEVAEIYQARHDEPFVVELYESFTQSISDLIDLLDRDRGISVDYIDRLRLAKADLFAIQRRHQASFPSVDDEVPNTPRFVAVTVGEAADIPSGVGSAGRVASHSTLPATHADGGDCA